MVICVAEKATTILTFAHPSSPLSRQFYRCSFGMASEIIFACQKKNATAVGLILVVLGTWIRLMTFRHSGRFFFRFEASIQKDHELIVSRPHAVVRHPSYTGFLFLFIGWFPWQMSEGSWIIESGLWNVVSGRILVLVIHLIRRGNLPPDSHKDPEGGRSAQWNSETVRNKVGRMG
jgi:hypothetical protein